jgi:hypothetical protein
MTKHMNAPDPVPPCTPPKPTGNGGAGRVDPDGQKNSDSEDLDEPQSAMSKRKWNGRESWTSVNRGVLNLEEFRTHTKFV